jgi:hypothetical protein
MNVTKTSTEAPMQTQDRDQQVKRGRGRPKGAVTKKPKATAAQHGTPDQPENSPYIDIKAKMTLQELNFLEIYLSGRVTIDKAMIQAGYGHYSQDWRYKLAQKIVIKYEAQADDHRKIFREMGAGEVAVVEGLLGLARGAKSEMVRLNAYTQIAKCLGLTKEILEGAGGVTIIFEASDKPQPSPGAHLPPSQGEIKVVPTSTKPMMITK